MMISAAIKFTPVVSFEDGGSQYLDGMSYSVRDGNAALREKVTQWHLQGKIRIEAVRPRAAGESSLRGTVLTGGNQRSI